MKTKEKYLDETVSPEEQIKECLLAIQKSVISLGALVDLEIKEKKSRKGKKA